MSNEATVRAKITALRAKLARAPDDLDWKEHIEGLIADEEAKLPRLRPPPVDRELARAYAEALAAAIIAAGGPKTTRAWYKAGVGARVYFPGEAGFLTVGADGSVSEKLRGQLTFQASGLFPSGRKAVKDGRQAYIAARRS